MNPLTLPILMYHDICEQENEWCVPPQQFAQQMLWLKEQGWKTLSLSELRKSFDEQGELSDKSVILTFDDGRSGVFEQAFPLLQKLGFTATVFVVPSWTGISQSPEIPSEEKYSSFMSWNELRLLRDAGWEIGSHSFSHQDMSALSPEEFCLELTRAEEALAQQLGIHIQHFCYPLGKYSSSLVSEISQRYATAVTIERGFSKEQGRYARQWVMRETSLAHFQKLLTLPTLSLCMIVKNEELFLGQCLSSVQGLVNEIIIVDTGSTDRTKEIARQYGAQVHHFDWCDDFAAARNFSLQQATGDWILVLDADEVISAEDHQRIREAVNCWDVAGFQLVTRNYSSDSSLVGWTSSAQDHFARDFPGWFPSLKVRLFQRVTGAEFAGKVHELISEKNLGKVKMLPVPVHHYGALRQDFQQKTEMHLRLTQAKVQENPKDAKAFYELGVQYKLLEKFAEAEKALQQSLLLDHSQAQPLLELAGIQQKQGKISEARENYLKVLTKEKEIEKRPLSSILLAQACFGLGYGYFLQQELQKAAQYFAQVVIKNPQFVEAYVNLGAVLEKAGKYKEAHAVLQKAITLAPGHARAYYNQGVVLEKAGVLAGAVESYKKAVELGYKKKEEANLRVREIEMFLSEP